MSALPPTPEIRPEQQMNKLGKTGIPEDQAAAVVEIVGEQVHGVVSSSLAEMSEKYHFSEMATKKDLEEAVKGMATKKDLEEAVKGMATKKDFEEAVKGMATKKDLEEAVKGMATKDDLKEAVQDMATKKDLEYAIQGALKDVATKEDLKETIQDALKGVATKEDIAHLVEKHRLYEVAHKSDFQAFAEKENLEGMRKDIAEIKTALRYHLLIFALLVAAIVSSGAGAVLNNFFKSLF